MKIEINQTDFTLIEGILVRAACEFETDMLDVRFGQAFRDRRRENAKIARTALAVMREAAKEGDSND